MSDAGPDALEDICREKKREEIFVFLLSHFDVRLRWDVLVQKQLSTLQVIVKRRQKANDLIISIVLSLCYCLSITKKVFPLNQIDNNAQKNLQ